MNFTVIGGFGFIGSAVVECLRMNGHNVFVPNRDNTDLIEYNHGHIIYAAGVTADFRERPFDTVKAHICILNQILEHANFNSLLYLSSARMYRHAAMAHELEQISVMSEDGESFYDITKLAGEAICHASGRKNVRVARLTNVIGRDFYSNNFLFDLIKSAYRKGKIELRSSLDSAKDYVLIEDVANLLLKIATQGKHKCYNVGSGTNISHLEIVGLIAEQLEAEVEVLNEAPKLISEAIDISRIMTEFKFEPQNVLMQIPTLVTEYRKFFDDKDRS
jgi:nucleoside-diphosphate-sugar epimerase